MARLLSGLACGLALAQSIGAVFIDQELNEGIPDTGLDTSSWTAGALPNISDMFTLNDFQIAAKNTMSAKDYAQYRTGTLDETTYMNNMNIWRKVWFNAQILQDVSVLNLNTTIMGYNFSAPYFIAPAANLNVSNPDAEAALVRAAANAGILYIPSIGASLSIESVAAAGAEGQVMFHQEYIWSNTSQIKDELRRMESAGFKAVVLALDNTGVTGIRDRAQRFTPGSDPGRSLNFTIEALHQLRNWTSLPIIPKGIKSAKDVKLCADLGFPAVYISNHGGRVVDNAPTALEILLDLHVQYPEVFGQIEIYADGGVRRGNHVLMLLALGVRAVGLGRPPMFANVYGQPGVEKLLSILHAEMQTEMRLLGETDVNRWRGNASLINTRKVELDYFGAPMYSLTT